MTPERLQEIRDEIKFARTRGTGRDAAYLAPECEELLAELERALPIVDSVVVMQCNDGIHIDDIDRVMSAVRVWREGTKR